MKASGFDNAAIIAVLVFHLAWILWVIFGAFLTRGRRWLSVFHVASLVWGILVEVGPWLCPLTIAEDSLQQRAGLASSHGNFLQHYLSLIVYPNVSESLLVVFGVAVCAVNLIVYARRAFQWICRRPSVS